MASTSRMDITPPQHRARPRGRALAPRRHGRTSLRATRANLAPRAAISTTIELETVHHLARGGDRPARQAAPGHLQVQEQVVLVVDRLRRRSPPRAEGRAGRVQVLAPRAVDDV